MPLTGYALPFEHPLSSSTLLCGGKGANLSILALSGFPVPPGFVVTAEAYRAFLAEVPGMADRAAKLDFGDPVRLVEQTEAICRTLESVPIPPAVTQAVTDALARFPARSAFAVRSSSTLEDMATCAFAGQHDTFLNCTGTEAVLGRIRACWISLWRHRAVAYRNQSGFDAAEAEMAVVVQEMVFPEVAGVGFSINPVTGALGEMLIDANYGLGESVVGGEAEVDQLAVEKKTLHTTASRIGRKTKKIVASPEGGTAEIALDEDEGLRCCLDDASLRAVSELLLRVEARFRFPQDIEWAISGGRLYLLQSRPVTTVPPRWTRDESAERFPAVVTPLTWDLVEEGFHHSLDHSFRLMGFPPFKGKWFSMHDHYIYGNQNAVALFLHQSPVAVDSLDDLRALIPLLREKFRWVQELPVRWSTDLDRYLLGVGALQVEPIDGYDVAGIWDYVMRVNRLGTDYFLPNIAISITQSLLHRVLFQLLAFVAGPEEGARLYDGLMAHCETRTGAINRELFDLAEAVRRDPELERLLIAGDSKTLSGSGALAAHPEFLARFERFLSDHGHREVDFDAYHPTWVDASWLVLDNIRLIVENPPETHPDVRQRALKLKSHHAEFELFRALPDDLHYFFLELVRLCRTYTSLDDLEHYQTTRLTLPMRKGLRALGTKLVAAGILEEPMDIFFARLRPLASAVGTGDAAAWREIGESVCREKALYLLHRSQEPPWTLGEDREGDDGGGDFLEGSAGSPGVAEGEIYPVLSPEDFSGFPAGAVLLAKTTSPTWTPLFYSACAVITESGGPLSHGAVTAREMRIPAVMSLRGCMAKLAKGQRVRVDGSKGRVYPIPEGGGDVL